MQEQKPKFQFKVCCRGSCPVVNVYDDGTVEIYDDYDGKVKLHKEEIKEIFEKLQSLEK